MAKTSIEELESVLLDQIEKLNQDDLMSNTDETKCLIDRSKAISDLTNSYIDIQRTKLDAQRVKIEAVRVATHEGYGLKYDKFLGIENDTQGDSQKEAKQRV